MRICYIKSFLVFQQKNFFSLRFTMFCNFSDLQVRFSNFLINGECDKLRLWTNQYLPLSKMRLNVVDQFEIRHQ